MCKKGHVPWNKGIKTGLVPKSAFQKGNSPWNKDTAGLMPIPWMKGKVHSETTKSLISSSRKGKSVGEDRYSWKGGKPLCKQCGVPLSNYGYEFCQRHVPRDYKKLGLIGAMEMYKRNPTSIELKVYDKLKELGIIFETQKLINGRFVVDAYIPSLNLVIEVDGNYWHSLDRIIKKDRAENAYLSKCGYGVLRLAEEEVASGKFVERMVC